MGSDPRTLGSEAATVAPDASAACQVHAGALTPEGTPASTAVPSAVLTSA